VNSLPSSSPRLRYRSRRVPRLSATTGSRIASTCLGYRRSIFATRAREPYPRPVTTYYPRLHPRRGVSHTRDKQCRSCAQWRRNAKNRSARNSSAPRMARIPSIDGRARINDDQIHRHKVKGPQWPPLAASSLLVAETSSRQRATLELSR